MQLCTEKKNKPARKGQAFFCWVVATQIFVIFTFHPYLGKYNIYIIFFRWAETTNWFSFSIFIYLASLLKNMSWGFGCRLPFDSLHIAVEIFHHLQIYLRCVMIFGGKKMEDEEFAWISSLAMNVHWRVVSWVPIYLRYLQPSHPKPPSNHTLRDKELPAPGVREHGWIFIDFS